MEGGFWQLLPYGWRSPGSKSSSVVTYYYFFALFFKKNINFLSVD